MFARQSVELPQSTYLALREHLRRNGSANDISSVLVAAVDLWLAQQHEAAGIYGYQWKTVFLPDGTVLRSSSYGEHDYAHVKGDQIIYEGRAISPNQLAQSFARSTRNAWNDLFIRRPGDKTFKQACVLRQEIACEEQALRQARLAAACPPVPRAPAVTPSPAEPPSAIPARPASAASVAAPAAPGKALPAQSAADLSPAALAAMVTSVLAHMTPPRDTTPNPGWNLPERRKYRYRLEDVTFE
jgi:hypothetical protein